MVTLSLSPMKKSPMPKPTDVKKKESLSSLLFGAAFVIGFLITACATAKMAADPVLMSVKARYWENVPAKVTDHYLDARVNQYSLYAEYTYVWDDIEYISTGVFFDEGVGVRKKYYRKIAKTFTDYSQATNPLTVWVNPENPVDSILYKHVRWDKFLFRFLVSLFCLTIGLGPLVLWAQERRKRSG